MSGSGGGIPVLTGTGWQTVAPWRRPVTPPRTAPPGELGAIDLIESGLHDEFELEDVHVTGEARELRVRKLELSAALLDDVDLAGGRLPRLALRSCRITGGSLGDWSACVLRTATSLKPISRTRV